jgi:hypothetical protein
MLLLGPEEIDKYIHCIIKNNTIILFCLQKEKYKYSAMEKFVPTTNHLSAPPTYPLFSQQQPNQELSHPTLLQVAKNSFRTNL